MRTSFLALALVACFAAPAAAQNFELRTLNFELDQTKPPQKPAPAQTTKPKPKPVPKLPLGFRAFGAFETTSMAASSTFEAMTGSASVIGFGGGGEILNIWRKVFLRVGFSKGSTDGTRGFVTSEGFISSGVPVEIGVRNVEISAGWRTYLRKQQKIALYFGGGLLLGTISQESEFAAPGENSSETGKGFVFTGGLEYALTKIIVAGVEGQYRSVGGVLGTEGSVSGGFSDDNAGGAAIRALIGVRFRR